MERFTVVVGDQTYELQAIVPPGDLLYIQMGLPLRWPNGQRNLPAIEERNNTSLVALAAAGLWQLRWQPWFQGVNNVRVWLKEIVVMGPAAKLADALIQRHLSVLYPAFNFPSEKEMSWTPSAFLASLLGCPDWAKSPQPGLPRPAWDMWIDYQITYGTGWLATITVDGALAGEYGTYFQPWKG